MSSRWPKVIRDPVHDIIPFEDTPCDRLLLDLINTREFQRSRRIKQLGVSELVFPGANHSRFAHSIGVLHTARMFLEKIQRLRKDLLDPDQQTLVLAASLIHDVGHGPLSHTFEAITNEKHEARTLEIILDDSTEVNACLRNHSDEMPKRLAIFFDENIEDNQLAAAGVPVFLTQVVSSQLDADRFDYLLRDSYATGTDYGSFDLRWLVHHLELDLEKGRFYLSRKALSAAEDYVFARYHMYRTVYFHKTTRAAEVMLKLIFARFRELAREAGSLAKAKGIAPEAPRSVIEAFTGKLTLGQYLALDDHSITEFLKGCARSKDEILRDLSAGVLNRCLFKAIDATEIPASSVGNFRVEAEGFLQSQKLDPKYSLVDDNPSDTPYRPYDPDAEKPATQIYVESQRGGQAEISTQSGAIETLKKEYTFLRYYCPEGIREPIAAIARKHFEQGGSR
jgi:uncharacterized protein